MRTSEKFRLAAIVAVVLSGGVWVDSVLAFPPGGPGGGEPGGCDHQIQIYCPLEGGGMLIVTKCADDYNCPAGTGPVACDDSCDPPMFTIRCVAPGGDCPTVP